MSRSDPAPPGSRTGQEADHRAGEQEAIYEERPALRSYVSAVGSKLAAGAGPAGLSYRFEILDTPELGAFALPGGSVYVTRGLLTVMNSEDELAAVLGHEIAHLAAGHGASRRSGGRDGGAGGPSVATHRAPADPRDASILGLLAGPALEDAALGFPKEEEREADDLAVRYARQAGYSPRGAIDLLGTVGRIEKKNPRRVESWLKAHPAASERIAGIEVEAKTLSERSPEEFARPLRREEFLRMIDGVSVGWVNKDAFVVRTLYVNTKQEYSLRIPKGWSVGLRDAEIVMMEPSAGLRATVEIAPLLHAGGVAEIARDYGRNATQAGLEQSGAVMKATLPAGEAAILVMTGQDGEGRPVVVRKMFLPRFDRMYILTYTAPAEKAEADYPTFMTLTGNFKLLRPDQVPDFSVPRVALYTARAGETWSSIAESRVAPGVGGGDLAEFNGREAASVPEAGLLVKIPPAFFFEGTP